MFKKARVVMLPTTERDPSNIMLCSIPKELAYYSEPITNMSGKSGVPHHLYITSEDSIIPGDWCIYKDLIVQATSEDKDYAEYRASSLNKYGNKIIATTDTALKFSFKNEGVEGEFSDGDLKPVFFNLPLPQPSPTFIKKYIHYYNKHNPITDVLVEYDVDEIMELSSGNTPSESLKVMPNDNTIVIEPIKQSWTRDEVIDLIHHFRFSGEDNVDEWIESNI